MADQIALEFVPLVEGFLARVRELAGQVEQALLPLEQGEQLRLDVSQAERELEALRDQLLQLGATPVAVRFDEAAAEAGVEALRARLVELQAVAEVVIDPGPAVAGLETIGTAAGAVAGALGQVGVAAGEAGVETAAGAAAATPPLAKVAELAYVAANAVGAFATRAATANEVTPQLSLLAGRAAASVEALAAGLKVAAATVGPATPGQIATLEALTASLHQAQAAVDELAGAEARQAAAAEQSAAANRGAAGAAAGVGASSAGAVGGVSALSNAMRLLASTTAFYLGLRVARFFSDLISGSVDAKEAIDRITSALERSRGAGAGEAAELTLLRKTTEDLGLRFAPFAEHYAKFTETLKGSEVPIRTQQNLLLGVGTALAATHRPAEEAGRVFEIFSRLAAKDEVNVRLLAGSLNEAIPGSMRIAAAALFQGADSLARFEAASKKGQVSALDFLEVIGPAYIREFEGQLPAAVDSTTASLNRLKNAEFDAQVQIGTGFAPAVHQATEEFQAFLAIAGDTPRALGEVVALFVWLGTKIGEAVAVVGKAVSAVVQGTLAGIYEMFTQVATGLRSLAEIAHLGGVAGEIRKVETSWREMADGFSESTARAVRQSEDLTAALFGVGPPSHQAGRDLADLTARGKDFAGGIDAQVSAIRRRIDAIERQADALGRGGAVERAAADELVKSIDKELKAIALLPPKERQALAERTAVLDQLRTHYQVFTDAYIKLQERQERAAESLAAKEAKLYKEREDALLRFLGKMQADEDKAAAERAKRSGDLSKSLDTQKGRLGELQDKPSNTTDEINEMDVLRDSIRRTEEEAKKLRDAQLAAGDAGARAGSEAEAAVQKVRDGFAQAVAQDDKLREAISRLGPAARSSLGSVLENLARLKGEGRLTEDDLRAGTAAIVGVFTQAGVVTAGLADRVAQLTHQSRDLRQTLAEVKTASQEVAGAQDKGAAASTVAAGASRDSGTAHKFNAEQAKEDAAATVDAAAADQRASEISIKRAEATSGLNDKLRTKTTAEQQLAGEIDKTTSAQDRATQSQESATAGTVTFRGEVVELSKATGEATSPSGGIMKMGDKVVQVGTAAKETSRAAGGLKTEVDGVATSMDKAGGAAEKAADGVGAAGQRLAEFKDSAQGTQEATTGIGTALSSIATGAAKVPAALQPIDILLGQIVGLKADEYLGRVDVALGDLGTDARDAATGLKDLLKVDFQKLREGFSWVVPTDTAMASLSAHLTEVVDLLKQVKTCQDALQA